LRYSHTNIIAKDWRTLCDFYIAVFQCTPVPPQRRQSGDWLARGTGVPGAALQGMHLRLPGYGDAGPTLEIFTYREQEPLAKGPANRQGFTHIAFAVDDVEATLETLLQHDGSRAGEIVQRQVPGVGLLTFIYARDPEGNLIEIQSWQ
jgi:catechol 2,3-dioxygenase-like lactoylglutathione lyase family enzyme